MIAVLAIALGTFVIAFALWRFVFFFRDPERSPPPGDDLLAPADGFVVYVHRVECGRIPIAVKNHRAIPLDELTALPECADASGTLIGIFMSAFNVHVNRAPLSGTVRHCVHVPRAKNRTMARMFTNILLGRRPIADGCAHLVENERLTIVIEGERTTVAVTQIADAWASWVVCNVAPGDRVVRGDRYGMIRMGSQVDLFLPDVAGMHIQPAVRAGDRTVAGETILARVLAASFGPRAG